MLNSDVKSIMLVGVGGQGTLLASKVLGALLVNEGKDVKLSEVHGMSQRGGSVVTYVKYGSKIESPVIERGEADLILGFEELEAYRWLPYLKKGGKMIANTQQITPLPVRIGNAKYPENIVQKIKEMEVDIIPIDAEKIANEAGNIKTANVALLGLLSKYMELSEQKWLDALNAVIPKKVIDVNLKAFNKGKDDRHVG